MFGLKTLEDFSGTYLAGGAGVTVFGGGEAATMKNQNDVVVEWTTSNVGVNFKLAAPRGSGSESRSDLSSLAPTF